MRLFMLTMILSSLLVGSLSAQRQPTTVITGATLIDGTGSPPVIDASVIMQGDRITRVGRSSSVTIPRGARVIDARGKFLLPGFIDTHLHLELVGLTDIGELPARWNTPGKTRELVAINAALDLIAGFTTVRDLGSTDIVLRIREEINAGRRTGPRIVAAGMQLVRTSSDAPPADMFLEYDSLAGGRSGVRHLAALGADVIKIRLTHMRPVPSLEEVRGIVDEAHGLGLRATVHTDVPADDLVQLAIDAGADGIEHNAPLRSQDDRTLARMAQQNMSLMAGAGAFYIQRIDTTALIRSLDRALTMLLPDDILSALHTGIESMQGQTDQMKKSGWSPSQRQASFTAEVQRARNAGVLLVFGTDCGGYGMVHGEQYKALYGESMMGSSPMEVIVMATRDAARALGREKQIGTVEEGKQADLVLLNADPLLDLRNCREVFRVIKGGTVYDPAALESAWHH